MFPSPCGEKVGINESPCSRTADTLRRVSVPLRGKGRDQPVWSVKDRKAYLAPFPSPCGEKVGINTRYIECAKRQAEGFPSPCGEKVGINSQGAVFQQAFTTVMPFPSPCGEKVGINAECFEAAMLR